MKKIIMLCMLFHTMKVHAEEPILGEEYIKPLHYPKFSLMADYGMMRKFHGFADNKLRTTLPNTINVGLGFDTGLYRYFNAGAFISLSIAEDMLSDPTFIKFGLYGKPMVPLGERFSIFSRIGAGLGISLNSVLPYFARMGKPDIKEAIDQIYYTGSYPMLGAGGNMSTTIGFEYFPFSRMGISCEWGMVGEYYYNKKVPQNINDNAPSIHYLLYSFPVMLNLHIIL